jgi:hypothetical protein
MSLVCEGGVIWISSSVGSKQHTQAGRQAGRQAAGRQTGRQAGKQACVTFNISKQTMFDCQHLQNTVIALMASFVGNNQANLPDQPS